MIFLGAKGAGLYLKRVGDTTCYAYEVKNEI
jgi:hypothetical protein